MKKHTTKIVTALAVLSLAAGCGNDSSSSGKNSGSKPQLQEEEATPLDGSNIQGHYQAKFITLNPHVNGTIPGSANFYRQDDKLFAYVRLFAGGVKAWHMQHVYEGSRCPTINDDSNGDGFIDIQEAEAVVGKILIPMDSDITTQSSGRRFFPLADLSGYYHYERITSFKRFLNDLMDADNDPTDDVAKLPPGEGLRITGRVFMVLGVAETIDLPETVATKERRRAFQTLPIACGVFEKVETTPGSAYVQDEIPGPVAEVEPGQDRPADDQIPDTTGGSTSGSGSGSNTSDDGDGPTSDGDDTTRTTGGTSGGSTGGTRTTGGTSGGTHTSGDHTSGGTTSGGSTTGSTDEGSTTGSTTGSTEEGSTTGSSTSTDSGTTGSTTTTTTTSSSSSSTSSSSTGGTTGGFLGSSSGI